LAVEDAGCYPGYVLRNEFGVAEADDAVSCHAELAG
jgi:hypothetical protein